MLTSVFTVLLVCSGVYFTVSSRGFALRRLPRALRSVFGGKGEGEGISVYSALCTDLAATLGTGNIVGVAAAVLTGGPGALVWMVVFSFFSMSTKCAENILAVKYRERDGRGRPMGGPFSYIRLGLGKRWAWMARFFAFACAAGGALGLGTVIQSNSIGLALSGLLPGGTGISLFILSSLVTIPAAMVILGGAERIARLAEKLVPVMAMCYLAACLLILVRFAGQIPRVVGEAFCAAFSLRAAGGAALGQCLSVGIRRSVFSNEAGLGTAPIAAGASRGDDPLEQGDAGIVSVFVDTTFLCTLTGLCLLVTGSAEGQGSAVGAATAAWELGLPLSPKTARTLLSVFLSLFAFSTILGWNFYAERSWRFLFPDGRGVRLYQLLYLTAVFLGPFLSADSAWRTADLCNACMALPNLTALFLLRREALEHMK